MAKILKTQFKLRRANRAEWEEKNPVLAAGEPGVELDTHKLKLGDGLTAWNNLPYAAGGSYEPGAGIDISDDAISVKIDNETIKLNSQGNLSAEMPVASATILGGIKVGENLSIAEDGTLNASGGEACWEPGEGEHSAQTIGTLCRATGDNSVAEGELSQTGTSETIEDWREGKGAHAEGGNTTAAGNYSHAEGNSTVTNNPYEHAQGHFNISNHAAATYPNAGNTIHSIGIGSNLQNRKNAFEIMQNGDAYLLGVGNYDGTNPNEAQTLQAAISAGGGAQSDWSQNDSTASDYIKNRPFYEEIGDLEPIHDKDGISVEVSVNENILVMESGVILNQGIVLSPANYKVCLINDFSQTILDKTYFAQYQYILENMKIFYCGNSGLVEIPLPDSDPSATYFFAVIPINQDDMHMAEVMLIDTTTLPAGEYSNYSAEISFTPTTIHKLEKKFLNISAIEKGIEEESSLAVGEESIAKFRSLAIGKAFSEDESISINKNKIEECRCDHVTITINADDYTMSIPLSDNPPFTTAFIVNNEVLPVKYNDYYQEYQIYVGFDNNSQQYVVNYTFNGVDPAWGSGQNDFQYICSAYSEGIAIQGNAIYNSIAIGENTSAETDSIGIGYESKASDSSIAVGWKALAAGTGIAIGNQAKALSATNGSTITYNSIAIGDQASATEGIAIGKNSKCTSNSLAISGAYAKKGKGIFFGEDAYGNIQDYDDGGTGLGINGPVFRSGIYFSNIGRHIDYKNWSTSPRGTITTKSIEEIRMTIDRYYLNNCRVGDLIAYCKTSQELYGSFHFGDENCGLGIITFINDSENEITISEIDGKFYSYDDSVVSGTSMTFMLREEGYAYDGYAFGDQLKANRNFIVGHSNDVDIEGTVNASFAVGIGYNEGNQRDGFIVTNKGELIVPSSTENSKKYFKITVDDSGTISATEVIN